MFCLFVLNWVGWPVWVDGAGVVIVGGANFFCFS
jgi:hypothetical protein